MLVPPRFSLCKWLLTLTNRAITVCQRQPSKGATPAHAFSSLKSKLYRTVSFHMLTVLISLLPRSFTFCSLHRHRRRRGTVSPFDGTQSLTVRRGTPDRHLQTVKRETCRGDVHGGQRAGNFQKNWKKVRWRNAWLGLRPRQYTDCQEAISSDERMTAFPARGLVIISTLLRGGETLSIVLFVYISYLWHIDTFFPTG